MLGFVLMKIILQNTKQSENAAISHADDSLGLFPIHAIQATNNTHNHAFHSISTYLIENSSF